MPAADRPVRSRADRLSPPPPAASARSVSRRSFVGTASTACGAGALPLPTGGLFSAGAQRLRIGLVGCGGRGTGAARQALEAEPSAHVVALGDLFDDQVASAAELLRRAAGARFACPPERRFVGPDAYARVIASGVDVILLAGPPHVRPLHLEAAVAAGKHVYCEKPVAVDVAGVARAAAAAARGRAAGLALVSGFCCRRDAVLAELAARIRDGGIGGLLAARAHAAIGLPWRKPLSAGQDSGEWPIRNWISFARFSGGHFVEHHVEALDRIAWMFGDAPPLTARPADRAPEGVHDATATGAIGDCRPGMAVRYLFADGRVLEASVDRRERPRDRVEEVVVGTAGRCDLVGRAVIGRRPWTAEAGPLPGRHRAAIEALLAGVLSGCVPHDGKTMCHSTLLAVMGRQAAEAGQPVDWAELSHALAPLA